MRFFLWKILPYCITNFLASINASNAVMLLLIMLVTISPLVVGLLSLVISFQICPKSSLFSCSFVRSSSFCNCISSIVVNVFSMFNQFKRRFARNLTNGLSINFLRNVTMVISIAVNVPVTIAKAQLNPVVGAIQYTIANER